ncbi:NEW3 domain-containing protein [Actinospica robiniae]|uniref:NEW3 domain-containing protein n=1 Tax=Actinospica robiniae TaxID=304901 RepID=UPI00146F984E|nr:NEW3 domain-containing protein [Actinospica robiniae]
MQTKARSATVALAAAVATLAGFGLSAPAAEAATPSSPTATLVVDPGGDDRNPATAARPVATLARAQQIARGLSTRENVVIDLLGGTYQLAAPLTLTSADSGRDGHTITWQGVPGQHPVLSGGQQVTGWQTYDKSASIYVAHVPKGEDSRQLYVNGALAPRASITIARSDVQVTASGMTIVNPALDYLATLPEQNRIEVESEDSFTDRYAPVQSISGTTVTMQQPAWNNNNWGYDDIAHPFAGGTLMLENSLAFVQSAGQWYLDPQAGLLYYKAAAGQSPKHLDVELPRLTSLLQISGSYSDPVTNLAIKNIGFEYTTWLTPGTSIGYADQQNGTFLAQQYTQPANFISTCSSGCTQFEATRNSWVQIPAAVQVSAASDITFSGDSFEHLGQVGLGIGNDADATYSGPGLGASDITVYHNTFTDDSGAGVVAGGVQPDAHHPSNPGMIVQNVTIADNLVTNVAEDYKDMSGILSTYATHTVITHNEVSDLAYDGIDFGWGWGMNDPGGSQDYVNRGTYNYQPIYTTPTTLADTVVTDNLVHGTKKVFHDGGSIYNLSANPNAVVDDNYIYDNHNTVGLYLDEGSRYITLTDNVVQDAGVWAFTNASSTNNTDDNTFSDNWYNNGATQISTGAPHDNVATGNVQVASGDWPLAAQQVMYNAGIEPSLRTSADTIPAPAGLVVTPASASVSSGGTTQVDATIQNFAKRPLSDLRLALSIPSGWSVTPSSKNPHSLPPGESLTASWTVTAPASVSAPIAQAAVGASATYRRAGSAYTGSASTNLTETGALTSLKSYGSVPSAFGQSGGSYAILAGGNDIWGAGGEHYDEYGSIYSPQAAGPSSTVTVEVDSLQNVNAWTKGGLVLRDAVTGAGSSQGYVALVVTPSNGVSLQWQDASTPGYLDQDVQSPSSVAAPVWLRLVRDGDQVSAYYSADDQAWNQVGSAITLTGATTDEDAGMIVTAHSPSLQAQADFSNFSVSDN